MTWLQALLLGVIQGLTEFLPISSSGHLVLSKQLLGVSGAESAGAAMEVFLHAGTMFSVVVAFRRELLKILVSLVRGFRKPNRLRETFTENQQFRVGIFLLLASLPAAAIGLSFRGLIESTFQTPWVAVLGLFATGVLLVATRLVPPQNRPITVSTSLIIGFAQAAAMIPGVSRSGATISAGLFRKVPKDVAARFSFFLSVPAIFGANALKLIDLGTQQQATPWGSYLLGACVSFAVGWAAIRTVLVALKKEKFHLFGAYCVAVAFLAALSLMGWLPIP